MQRVAKTLGTVELSTVKICVSLVEELAEELIATFLRNSNCIGTAATTLFTLVGYGEVYRSFAAFDRPRLTVDTASYNWLAFVLPSNDSENTLKWNIVRCTRYKLVSVAREDSAWPL